LVILKKPVAGLTVSSLSRFVARACRWARLEGGVNVLVTTDREMRGLNHRFRKKNAATDVLSFPAARNPGEQIAGDIAISAETAVRNARRAGHSGGEEIKVLALHGILHLAGFDHERDQGEMAREELRLRSGLGLPSGLIERAMEPGNRRTKHSAATLALKKRTGRADAVGIPYTTGKQP
jgi:probable rRNA maturation factor